MKKTFLNSEKPILTVMVQADNPGRIKELIDKSLPEGAEAFGMQFCKLKPEFRTPEIFRELFSYTDKPVYITNYRHSVNDGKTEEEIGEELVEMAGYGATLCDVPADFYDPQPLQFTEDPEAVRKQKELIDRIHQKGAEVLMSDHICQFTDYERVLHIAKAMKERGADICKIVVRAENMDEQIENLRIIHKLREEIDIPLLFLCGGKCRLVRNLGGELGCCMYLCVEEYDNFSTPAQPLLKNLKMIRDGLDDYKDEV